MRISRDKADSGFAKYCELWEQCKRMRVTLDGVEQKYVETADDAEGFVVRDKIDETIPSSSLGVPHFVIDGDCFVVETLRGKVTIEIVDVPLPQDGWHSEGWHPRTGKRRLRYSDGRVEYREHEAV